VIAFLSEIQNDLANITTDLKDGRYEAVANDIHYLHAYIEARKKDFEAEAALPAEELVSA
jgi:hypothetical protein